MVPLLLLIHALANGAPASGAPPLRVAVSVDDLLSSNAIPAGSSRLVELRKLIRALKRAGVHGAYAFHPIDGPGSRAEQEKAAREWTRAGYGLGNHTATHLDLDKVTIPEFEQDLLAAEPMLRKLSPKGDWKYLRFPYLHEGATAEKAVAARTLLARHGYRTAKATIPFADTMWNQPYLLCRKARRFQTAGRLREEMIATAVEALEAAAEASQAVFQRQIPQILLIHANYATIAALPGILEAYRKKGVVFIGFREAMRDEAYARKLPPASARFHFFFQQWIDALGLQQVRNGPSAPSVLGGKIPADCLPP